MKTLPHFLGGGACGFVLVGVLGSPIEALKVVVTLLALTVLLALPMVVSEVLDHWSAKQLKK